MIASTSCLLCKGPTEMVELCQLSFGSIVRCQECGLVRVFPPRSADRLARLYSTPEAFHHPYYEARRDLSRDTLVAKQRALLNMIANGRTMKGARLLDIGCDTGALLVMARDEFGMEVLGLEVSQEAARVAHQEHGLDVVVGQITELELPDSKFDFITLVDVIEHVSDPSVLLSEVQRLLRSRGKVYIATSDHDALINTIGLALYRLLGARSWGLLEKLYIPYHEFYFTRSTLARLVEQSGLQIAYHAKREFPLNEFGHGLLLKLGLVPIFVLQRLTQRQTLQELIAKKEG